MIHPDAACVDRKEAHCQRMQGVNDHVSDRHAFLPRERPDRTFFYRI